jgi:hypothetical protein
MKKGSCAKLRLCSVSFVAVITVTALVFTGCDHGAGGSSRQTGTVTLNIGFEGDASDRGDTSDRQESYSRWNILRTVYPETSAVTSRISKYGVTFTPSGGGSDIGPVELDTENPQSIKLAVGAYTATVTAYESDGDVYTAIAEGIEEDVQVLKGQDTTVDILLGPAPDMGAGTLSYDITITNIEAEAKIIITPVGSDVTVADVSLNNGANKDAITLPSGVYTVFVSLVKDIGEDTTQYAGSQEVVYIYKGLTVALPTKEYKESDFVDIKPVSLPNLSGKFAAPAAGEEPASAITATPQYSGRIAWKQGDEDFSGTEFGATTVYTAVVTLKPVMGFTFSEVVANYFSYTGASVTNAAGSNVVTIVFPVTGPVLGSTSVNLGFLSENITINTAQINPGNIAAQGVSPSRLAFYVPDKYTNVAWYVDGNPAPASNGRGIMINPNDYTVKSHTLNVIGTKKGKLSSGSVEFTVRDAGTVEPLTLIALDDLTDHLALLPANTVDEPHLVSLAPFSVSDTAKWEALKTALATLKNGNVYINLDLRACTAIDSTITGGSSGNNLTSSHFNYITYTTTSSIGAERLVGLMLPSTVTTIGSHALYSSKALRSITIPLGVTVVENNAFDSCSGLTGITIPASVQSIGTSAFTSCSNITIVFLDSVPSSLGATNSLPNNLNKKTNLVLGIYEYVSGGWSKVD